jgi:mono/diheme cytochrome c family protein
MKRKGRGLLIAIVVVPAVAAGLAAAGWYFLGRGFSARDEPSSLEAAVALRLRSLATPRSARAAQNPVALTPEVLREALAHFADHCAICHANDGSGATEIGRGFYPKPPDMRQRRTQDLTDGEIFYIIHNGIRFTGMPAFGGEAGPEADEDSWKLVHFIRYLPQITADDLEEMKKYNPRNPAELQEEEELERFLRGEDIVPTPHKH